MFFGPSYATFRPLDKMMHLLVLWALVSLELKAIALENGDGLTACMRSFYSARNQLMQQHGVDLKSRGKRAKHDSVEDVD